MYYMKYKMLSNLPYIPLLCVSVIPLKKWKEASFNANHFIITKFFIHTFCVFSSIVFHIFFNNDKLLVSTLARHNIIIQINVNKNVFLPPSKSSSVIHWFFLPQYLLFLFLCYYLLNQYNGTTIKLIIRINMKYYETYHSYLYHIPMWSFL